MANILGESPRASGRAEIAQNGTIINSGDFVSKSGGFVTSSAPLTGKIIGLSNQSTSYSVTNQTVAKATLSYTVATDTIVVRAAIVGAPITKDDEGKFYNPMTGSTVDSTSESATDGKLRLVKFISSTLGEFAIV